MNFPGCCSAAQCLRYSWGLCSPGQLRRPPACPVSLHAPHSCPSSQSGLLEGTAGSQRLPSLCPERTPARPACARSLGVYSTAVLCPSRLALLCSNVSVSIPSSRLSFPFWSSRHTRCCHAGDADNDDVACRCVKPPHAPSTQSAVAFAPPASICLHFKPLKQQLKPSPIMFLAAVTCPASRPARVQVQLLKHTLWHATVSYQGCRMRRQSWQAVIACGQAGRCRQNAIRHKHGKEQKTVGCKREG